MKSNTAKSPINILYKKKRREIRFFISGRMEKKKKIDCFALKTWGHSFINIISLNCIVMCKRYNDSVYVCFGVFFFTIQNINHYIMAKKSPMVYKILYQYVILQWKKALLLQNYIIVVLAFQNRNRFFFMKL